MNPTKLKPFFEADKIKFEVEIKKQENLLYYQGVYTAMAIGTCFGKKKFPDKPIELLNKNSDGEELTEEQIKLEREKLILNLQLMQANYEISKTQESVP